MRGLTQRLKEASGHRAPVVALAPIEQESAVRPTVRPASREGKIHIGAYLDPGFKTSLLLLRAQTGEDTQTLIARALNELFRAHNLPVVGQD
jgi:hypothetical protein